MSQTYKGHGPRSDMDRRLNFGAFVRLLPILNAHPDNHGKWAGMQRGQFVGLFRKEQDAERYAEDAFKVEPT